MMFWENNTNTMCRQVDSGAESDSSDIPETMSPHQNVNAFLERNYVGREWKKMIMEREDILFNLHRLIVLGETAECDHMADIQRYEIQRFLSTHGYSFYEEQIMTHEAVWSYLADKMVYNERNRVMEFTDLSKTCADIEKMISFIDSCFELKLNEHWCSLIMRREEIWMKLANKMMPTVCYKEVLDIQKQEVDDFLSRIEVTCEVKTDILNQRIQWKYMADKMVFKRSTNDMEIPDWDSVYKDLERRRHLQIFLDGKADKHWKAYILSRDDILKGLTENLVIDDNTRHWKVAKWHEVFKALKIAEVNRFLSMVNANHLDGVWIGLATQMVYNEETRNMEIKDWQRIRRACEVTLEHVSDEFAAWTMLQQTEWRDLINNITSLHDGRCSIEIKPVFEDLKTRLVRKFLEDNAVDSFWQAFIMRDAIGRATSQQHYRATSQQQEIPLEEQLADSIIKLDLFMTQRNKLFPRRNQVLAAFRYCPLSALKVVLFGEDPRKPYAKGLAFSYGDRKESTLASNEAVRNIHRVIRDIDSRTISSPSPAQTSCCHINWARQGVLLLNSALTYTKKADKKIHESFWGGFMKALMNAVFLKFQELDVLCWSSASRKLLKEFQTQPFSIDPNNPSDPRYCPRYRIENPKHRIYPGPHPAERRGKFATEVKGPLTNIIERYSFMFTLETDTKDEVDQLTSRLGRLQTI